MNSRERVMAVLDRKILDRVPVFELMIDPKVIQKIMPGRSYVDLVDALDLDTIISPTPSKMYNLNKVGEKDGMDVVQSEWGEKRINTGDMVAIPYEHPIKNHADWERYQVPDADKPSRLAVLQDYVQRYKGQRAIICHLHDSFNYPSYLFGMDQLFLNMVLEPDWVKEVIAACNAHCVRLVELAVKAGADIIVFGDDVGGKSGPLMSPSHYHEFFLPGLVAVTQKAKELGARVFKHTDGNVNSLLPMFIEAGIEAFHPSDPSAGMDIVEVKEKYGNQLIVLGGMDTGEPLCEWSVPQIVEEVRKRICELAQDGGWMIASSNSIHSGVKPENYHAMVTAAHVYGNYSSLNEPISLEFENNIGKIPI